jgi:hypothetical protein
VAAREVPHPRHLRRCGVHSRGELVIEDDWEAMAANSRGGRAVSASPPSVVGQAHELCNSTIGGLEREVRISDEARDCWARQYEDARAKSARVVRAWDALQQAARDALREGAGDDDTEWAELEDAIEAMR